MAKRIWTDARLTDLTRDALREREEAVRAAVSVAGNVREVLARLELADTRRNRDRIQRRIRILGLDTSHFTHGNAGPMRQRLRRWTDDDLRSAVAAAASYRGAIRNLGLIGAGGNYDHVKRRIGELQLDVTHFTGQGWNVGMRATPVPKTPLAEVLVAGRWTNSHSLKRRLFRAGHKTPACERCGWAERSPDGRIPVELDHINGDRTDNRLENLRILCPNCHSLQPTHRGLNKTTRR